MTYIAPKPCRMCGEIFTPIPRGKKPLAETCGKRRCRGRLMIARRPFGESIAKANATKRAKRLARIAALVAEEFGPLTEREQALFVRAEQHGYEQGYNAGYTNPRSARHRTVEHPHAA